MDFICSFAINCLVGDKFIIDDNIAAIALWLFSALLSNIRFCSWPFSIAIKTALWTELEGVIIFSCLFSRYILLLGQFLTHTPHPKQTSLSITTLPSIFDIASIGHTLTHLLQLTHVL